VELSLRKLSLNEVIVASNFDVDVITSIYVWLLLPGVVFERLDWLERERAGEMWGVVRFDVFFRFAFGVRDRCERGLRAIELEDREEFDKDKERNRASGGFGSGSLERDGIDDLFM
jgi:hypothetical protein